jgi:hypothetical protein
MEKRGTHLATERAGLVTLLLQVRAPVLHPTEAEEGRYYLGLPFYRVQGYQAMLGVPMPDATQWD